MVDSAVHIEVTHEDLALFKKKISAAASSSGLLGLGLEAGIRLSEAGLPICL